VPVHPCTGRRLAKNGVLHQPANRRRARSRCATLMRWGRRARGSRPRAAIDRPGRGDVGRARAERGPRYADTRVRGASRQADDP